MEKIEYKGKEYIVKYNHNGNYDGRRTTTAYISEPYENGKPIKVILSAVAECSTKDQFSKKLGRKISFGRLKKLVEVHNK